MARGEAANAARPLPIPVLHPAWPMRQRGLYHVVGRERSGVGDVSGFSVGRSRLAGLMGACLRPQAELRRNEPGSAACDE